MDEVELANKENHRTLMKRLGVTVLVLIIYHLLGFVMIPGVNAKALLTVANNSSLTMLSMFSGGGFETYSIMSLGLTAYITAQIVVQLLQSDVIGSLTRWSTEGRNGRRKLDQVTRGLSLILAFIQSIGVTFGINEMTNGRFILVNSPINYLTIGILMTAGTFIAMWLGDVISQSGLGNGISVIIAAGILARVPGEVTQFVQSIKSGKSINWGLLIGAIVLLLLIVLLVTWFQSSEYRIRVQYSRIEKPAGSASYLPLKIIVPGVVPVIIASSLLAVPQTVLLFFQNQSNAAWYRIVQEFFTLTTMTGVIIYAALIIAFTYLYSLVQLEPKKIADNFSKQGAYIPGVHPGKETSDFLRNTLDDLSFPGSMFLTLISVIPLVASNIIDPNLQLGLSGSSILIITQVFMSIKDQINGLRMKNDYPDFMISDYKLSN